ncbi:hypothetical protein NDU88_005723 [Pleurodeles waltl]|uniref:Uncharacterized protein n=1 Tax=Pleurodeles waltl TaxID=8319 RepID=A0AAV7L8D8_PLEWA|nr:hypothetical protein NDU88_005723 [Pleurodeles waltl]
MGHLWLAGEKELLKGNAVRKVLKVDFDNRTVVDGIIAVDDIVNSVDGIVLDRVVGDVAVETVINGVVVNGVITNGVIVVGVLGLNRSLTYGGVNYEYFSLAKPTDQNLGFFVDYGLADVKVINNRDADVALIHHDDVVRFDFEIVSSEIFCGVDSSKDCLWAALEKVFLVSMSLTLFCVFFLELRRG